MKHSSILIALMILICLFLSACQLPSGTTDYPNANSLSAGEVPLLTIEAYSEYLAFLDTTELPDSFVSYNDIAHFGAFDNFVCLSDSRIEDYSMYMYTIIDGTGTELTLIISNSDTLHSQTLYTESGTLNVTKSNMRTVSANEHGAHTENGICYNFISGQLNCIAWRDGTLVYTISADDLSEYPSNATTPVAELLNIDNKSSAELFGIIFDTSTETE